MRNIWILFLLLAQTNSWSQSFDLVPLGIYGGGDESNLSAYLIGEKDQNSFLCLDAGTLRSGIRQAIAKRTFDATEMFVLKNYIKGYFISHGHLDHLSGLIINSPEDSKKNIYAFDFVIDILKDNYFTNASWSNFANEGESPILNKYQYRRLKAGQVQQIEQTGLTAEAFELSHVNPYLSSALLVKNTRDEYVLYLGDTGADRVEKSDKLQALWRVTAPLIKQQALKALMIEVSFPNSQAEHSLYGHLTPQLLQEELGVLENLSGKGSLKGLPVIITHLKPGEQAIEQIKSELLAHNPLQVNYIFPVQGKKLSL